MRKHFKTDLETEGTDIEAESNKAALQGITFLSLNLEFN